MSGEVQINTSPHAFWQRFHAMRVHSGTHSFFISEALGLFFKNKFATECD